MTSNMNNNQGQKSIDLSDAHSAMDQFVLETYLLLGAGTLAFPTMLPSSCLVFMVVFLVAYAAFILVFAKFALAAYSSYKYLFVLAMNGMQLPSETLRKLEDEEKRFRQMRNVRHTWYMIAAVSFLVMVFIKLADLILVFSKTL